MVNPIQQRAAEALAGLKWRAEDAESEGRPNAAEALRSYAALITELAGQVPRDGWKLVPEEPTKEMCEAGYSPFLASHDPMFSSNEPCGPIYRAMLAASPPPKEKK